MHTTHDTYSSGSPPELPAPAVRSTAGVAAAVTTSAAASSGMVRMSSTSFADLAPLRKLVDSRSDAEYLAAQRGNRRTVDNKP